MKTEIKYSLTDRCFYCGGYIAINDSEGDHMPIPKRNGGKSTVPACRNCHGIKDSIPLDKWPFEFIAEVIKEIDRGECGQLSKIFLGKCMNSFSDYAKKTPPISPNKK